MKQHPPIGESAARSTTALGGKGCIRDLTCERAAAPERCSRKLTRLWLTPGADGGRKRRPYAPEDASQPHRRRGCGALTGAVNCSDDPRKAPATSQPATSAAVSKQGRGAGGARKHTCSTPPAIGHGVHLAGAFE